MKALIHVLCTCVLAATAGAQSAAAQAPQTPKPGPENERLGYFVGKWTGVGEMKSGPMGPGGKMTTKDDCEWFEGHFSVICHSAGQSPMGASKSIGILGYSPEEKVYTYYGIDNSAMTMSTVPKGKVSGDTWTYDDEAMMGGQKVKSRVTIKELSPTAYTFKLEIMGPDGKWAPMMEAKSTKAGGVK